MRIEGQGRMRRAGRGTVFAVVWDMLLRRLLLLFRLLSLSLLFLMLLLLLLLL